MKLKALSFFIVSTFTMLGVWACGGGSSSSSSSSGGGTTSRAINAFLTDVGTVTVTGGSCTKTTRDTSSCQSARTTLGLSGDWLSFSCNVVLGLANASLASVTDYSSATYVTVTAVGIPDHKSNFFPTSGSYSFTANGYTVTGNYNDMVDSYSPTFPNPHSIAQQSLVYYIPISPTSATHATMGMGAVGVSVDGVPIFNSLAAGSDNIFSEASSFDECQGHPASGNIFHYHSEPYAVSYQDSNLIGVMRDGYFVYGRYDYGGSTDLDVSNTSSDAYIYGGHVGTAPTTGTGSRFHYHATSARGCYHRNTSGTTIYADDGNVTVNGSNPCVGPTGGGTDVTVYFLTGHGNGGTFTSVPTAADNGGTMQNSTTATRYYYGSAQGSCTGC
jgi:hypothetical protein